MRYRRYKKLGYPLIVIIVAVISCRKPYNPPAISSPGNYLVVEGVINSGSDSTYITLSLTVNLSNKNTSTPVLGAIVTVQGDQNTSYPLTENGNGKYSCGALNLDNTHNYRLSIKTSDNKQYVSAYTPVLNSPPIDSISYDTKGAFKVPGLNVYVNTHDPANKVVYYRWDYQETWMFDADYDSRFVSNGDTVLPRNITTDNIYTCWKSDTSSTILLGSSAKLAKAIIANAPLTAVVSTSEKIGIEYSILVTQYALTPEAYIFWTNLKTNTEQLGSIFDAEPSQINGNISCVTNPSEPVIGYISVGSTTSQRIFIKKAQLPYWTTNPFYPLSGCPLAFDSPSDPCCTYDFKGLNQVNEYINYLIVPNANPLIPINAILGAPGTPVEGYTASYRQCVDCTYRGTNKEPSFWQ